VILGGPVGESLDDDVVLVTDVDSEAAIRTRLADDPLDERGADDP
jgi:hypothetical protein